MSRLRRFEEHRYIGLRDSMTVYDCDDADQLTTVQSRIADDDLLKRKLVQTFGPDSLPEARNRGFHPPQ